MKIGDYNFTFGADPEFFVQKGGKPVSAYNLVPGNKKFPYKVDHGAVQVDGMALEFNIDPADNPKQFADNLEVVLRQIMGMVPGYEIHNSCVAEFGRKYIESQPAEASELGCNPDYNAYTGVANPRPDGAADFRTAAGHLHIGWTNGVDPHDPGHFNACRRLVRQLDRWIGVPSLFWDADKKRRDLYGKAGAFRPTHFGVEYRTLSNAWLLRPDHGHFLRQYVVHQAAEAIKELFENADTADEKLLGKSAEDIINESDLETAKMIGNYHQTIRSPKYFRENILQK